MIQTIEQIREQLNKVVDLIDTISYRESIQFKDFKLLQKVQKALFKLSFAIITDNLGLIIL